MSRPFSTSSSFFAFFFWCLLCHLAISFGHCLSPFSLITLFLLYYVICVPYVCIICFITDILSYSKKEIWGLIKPRIKPQYFLSTGPNVSVASSIKSIVVSSIET